MGFIHTSLKSRPRRAGVLLWCLVVIQMAGGAFSADRSAVVNEYEVKAEMIYNFTKFTEWPSNAFASAESPLVVGILGEDPFGKTMDEALTGETGDGRSIQVHRLTSDEQVTACHLVFVSRSEKGRLKSILDATWGRPILTIGETEGFAQLGGIINFVTVDKTIRFEINAGAAQLAGIKISSKLLNLPKAIKVKTARE